MNWRLRFLVLAAIIALTTVCLIQGATIDQQRALIRSFAQDPSCMHDPRSTR